MTSDEQKQYNSLSYDQRQEYDHIKRRRPNWSHNQIMAKLALDEQTINVVSKGHENPEDDPEILREILQGAKSFLIGVGCFIWDVFDAIDEAIDTLTGLIARGISYIGDKLSEFWDWLTS